MTDHPPHPDMWKPGTLTMINGPDGWHGTLMLNDIPVFVRKWVRNDDGTVSFEHQHASDGWIERYFDGGKGA